MGRLARPPARPERATSDDRPLSQVRLNVQVRVCACKVIRRAFQGDNGGQVCRRVVPKFGRHRGRWKDGVPPR